MCRLDFHINLCMDLRAHTARLDQAKTDPTSDGAVSNSSLPSSNTFHATFFSFNRILIQLTDLSFLRNFSSNLNLNAFRKFTVDTFPSQLFWCFFNPKITKAAVLCVNATTGCRGFVEPAVPDITGIVCQSLI